MSIYVDIPNTDIDQDSPLTVALMSSVRDNPIFVRLASTTISGDAMVEFTAFNSSLFENYLFYLNNIVPVTDSVGLHLRTSADSGSSYDSGASDYTWNGINGASGADSKINLVSVDTIGNDVVRGVSAVLHVFNPHSSNNTDLSFAGGYNHATSGIQESQTVGTRLSAAGVDAVRFFASSGNLSTGTITMYGMRL